MISFPTNPLYMGIDKKKSTCILNKMYLKNYIIYLNIHDTQIILLVITQ